MREMRRWMLALAIFGVLSLVTTAAYAQGSSGRFDVQDVTPWGVMAMVLMQVAGTVQQQRIKGDLPGKDFAEALQAIREQSASGNGIASILTTHMGQDIQQLEQIQYALTQISSNLTRINAEMDEAEKIRARNHESISKQIDQLARRMNGSGG